MIAIFDEDGGGNVDFQEFVSGLSAFSSKGNKEQKLRFAFKVYDIDRDGYISNGELFIVLKMMVGSNLKDQQLQQIVDKTIMEADLDKDGKISFEEFSKMVENTDVSMSMTLGEYYYSRPSKWDVRLIIRDMQTNSKRHGMRRVNNCTDRNSDLKPRVLLVLAHLAGSSLGQILPGARVSSCDWEALRLSIIEIRLGAEPPDGYLALVGGLVTFEVAHMRLRVYLGVFSIPKTLTAFPITTVGPSSAHSPVLHL